MFVLCVNMEVGVCLPNMNKTCFESSYGVPVGIEIVIRVCSLFEYGFIRRVECRYSDIVFIGLDDYLCM